MTARSALKKGFSMSISALSGFDTRALYASRSSSSAPSDQTQAPAPSQPVAKLPEINAGHDGDADDASAAAPNTSTLAGIQAAYASN